MKCKSFLNTVADLADCQELRDCYRKTMQQQKQKRSSILPRMHSGDLELTSPVWTYKEPTFSYNSVHWGINPPPPCSCQAPFKLPNCSSLPPFLGNLPLDVGFSWTPTTLKIGFFSEPLIYWSFSYLTPSNPLKVTKFSFKISQLESLVMTEKNIFAYKLFFVIKYFKF